MRGGFRSLVNPGTRISQVDLEATRAGRQELHEEVRLRGHVVTLLISTAPGDGEVHLSGEDSGGAEAARVSA